MIDILFVAAGDFAGGGIAAIRNLASKHAKAEESVALLAAPQKVTDRYFVIDLDEAVTAKLEMLRERAQIDLPVTCASGRRALLTLEKDAARAEVFERALQAWAKADGAKMADAADVADDGNWTTA